MISNFNPYPGFLNHATKWQCHDFQFQLLSWVFDHATKWQCHDFQFQSLSKVFELSNKMKM